MTTTLLYNKDCIEVIRGLRKDSVNLVLSDIPYGEVNKKSSGLRKLDRGNADDCNINLIDMVNECVRICNGSFYIFCGIGQISYIDKQFRVNGLTTRLCQWRKSNPSPMNGTRLWLSGSEFCVFARKPKSTFNRRCEAPIWTFPVGRSKDHPTEKPVSLMEYIIESSSNEGDTVIDFTMGSGSTGVAAKNLKRNFIGVEINDQYFEIAKNRLTPNGVNDD
jgi:DNA modification methylase